MGDIGKVACSVTPSPTCPLKCFVAISLENSRAKLTCIVLSFPVTTPPKVGSCVALYTGVLLLTLLVFYNLKSKSPCCPEEFEVVSTNFGGMMVHRLGSLLCASFHQLNIRSLCGNHNLCHICWGCCNVSQSFDRVKSWMIDLVFNAVKQLLQHTPFPETHCENPEAEPYVGRDGTGKAFSLKLPSYRPEWQHLILGGQKCFIGSRQICCQLARISQRMPPIRKQTVKHLVDLHCIELYSYIYAQHKMILWQFSHIVQTVLVMAKWIIADCITSSWLWVNLFSSQCKHESEILSQVTQRLKGLQSQKVINRMLKMLAQCQHPSICCVPVKSWRVVEDCHRLFSCLNMICHKPIAPPKTLDIQVSFAGGSYSVFSFQT